MHHALRTVGVRAFLYLWSKLDDNCSYILECVRRIGPTAAMEHCNGIWCQLNPSSATKIRLYSTYIL